MSGSAGLDLVHSFLVVGEELSFRRGAERLHIDQSALTRRIQKLEHGLGFRLVERTTRDVSLTQAGRAFHEDNAHLLAGYSDSVLRARRIADGKTGSLRIAYMAFAATELMPAAVARFRGAHPHVEVTMRYIRTRGQKLALARDEVDVGYMIGPFEHDDFHCVTLKTEGLYVVMPRGHPLTRMPAVTPRDLAGLDLVLGDESEWAEYRRHLADLFSAEGVEFIVTLEASNTLALIGLVAAGLGITVYPESLIGFLGQSVEVRPILHHRFRSRTVLVWKRDNRSRQVRAFVEDAKWCAAGDGDGALPGPSGAQPPPGKF